MFPVDISSETLFSAADLIFITAAFVGGVIRWKHICHPCEDNPDYYYPARKQTAIFYCASILWLPYVLAPLDPGVCIYSRILAIVYFPVGFALLIRRYFRGKKLTFRVLWTLYLVVPAVVMLSMCISLFLGAGEWIAAHGTAVLSGGAAFGAVLTAIMIGVLVWLRNRMEQYNIDNYSDDMDFPYRFAKVIEFAPLVWMAVMWAVFLSGNPWLIFVVDLLAAVAFTGFLCVILHPQKSVSSPLDEVSSEHRSLVDLLSSEAETMPDIARGTQSSHSDECQDDQADVADNIGDAESAFRNGRNDGNGQASDCGHDGLPVCSSYCRVFGGMPDNIDGICKYCSVAASEKSAQGSQNAVSQLYEGELTDSDSVNREGESTQNGASACAEGDNVGLCDDVFASQEDYDRVKEQVLDVVRRRFREPHLLKTDVLMEISAGDICRASRLVATMGYYNLVNMFRLEYARLYKAEHPRAKQDEIAVEAGFSSRTSYYKAKKRVGEIDYSIVSGVEL